jgi:hypothetical protein
VSSQLIDDLTNEGVVAVCRDDGLRWSVLAQCCRELSGRVGVRRIAVMDEPGEPAPPRGGCNFGSYLDGRRTWVARQHLPWLGVAFYQGMAVLFRAQLIAPGQRRG